MLVEFLFALLIVVVVVLMAVDVARTRGEGLHGHAEALAHGVKYPIAGVTRGDRGEAFPRQPAGTGGPDPGPAGPPASVSPPAGNGPRSQAASPAVPQGSRHGVRNWHVHSRLLLLVVVPVSTVVVVALCIVGIAGALRGTPVPAPNGPGHGRDVALALALGLAAAIVLALASWFTTVIARSLLQPLYKLRAGALQLAGDRLPATIRRLGENTRDGTPFELAPVDVESSDEIGEIARSFDGMRRELLRLTVADPGLRGKLNTMFVNLSHRGQSLVERQIRLLQNLQQGEQDPERLAVLLRLDRIANRMHRSSENLLILAGQEPSNSWNQPVALMNVIRVAASEVEESQRVSLNAHPDVAIVGPAVNDVVHLLAELIENAASFSAADMPVDISGRLLTSGGALLDITDRGVGMTPKELAYANWRLENPPAAEINVPKWIGLFVVARLAARHGLGVRLQPAEFGGLTALVWLPNEILTQPSAAPAPLRFSDPITAGTVRTRRGLHEAELGAGHATAGRVATAANFAPPAENAGNAQLDRRPVANLGRRSDTQRLPSARSAVRAGPAADTASPEPQSQDTMGEQAGVSGLPVRNSGGKPAGDIADGSDAPQVATQPETAAPVGQKTGPIDSAVVPSADGPAEKRALPIFNEVESLWFKDGRRTPASSGASAAAGSRWSSPVDAGWRAAEAADSPSSAGSTAAGLPRRPPNANLIPGAVPSKQAALPTRSAEAVRARLAGLQRGVGEGRAAAAKQQAENPGEQGEDEQSAKDAPG